MFKVNFEPEFIERKISFDDYAIIEPFKPVPTRLYFRVHNVNCLFIPSDLDNKGNLKKKNIEICICNLNNKEEFRVIRRIDENTIVLDKPMTIYPKIGSKVYRIIGDESICVAKR